MHKIEIRVADNGVVVERFEGHASQELWVYMGPNSPHSAALCVQGMLVDRGVNVQRTDEIDADLQKQADRFARANAEGRGGVS